jgi:hypothetical protein
MHRLFLDSVARFAFRVPAHNASGEVSLANRNKSHSNPKCHDGLYLRGRWGEVCLSASSLRHCLWFGFAIAMIVACGQTAASYLRLRSVQALAPWAVNGELHIRDERITKLEAITGEPAGHQR